MKQSECPAWLMDLFFAGRWKYNLWAVINPENGRIACEDDRIAVFTTRKAAREYKQQASEPCMVTRVEVAPIVRTNK